MVASHPKTLIIGITGLLGSGKTTAAQYLASECGFGYVRYSQVLAEWQKRDPERKPELQVVGWDVMSSGLQTELNRRVISKITPDKDWVVEGLRHPLDYESLKKAFASQFHLVYIESSQQERWERLQERYRTFKDFEAADRHPVEQQIHTLKQSAEFRITSGGSVEQLYAQLKQFAASLRKEDR